MNAITCFTSMQELPTVATKVATFFGVLKCNECLHVCPEMQLIYCQEKFALICTLGNAITCFTFMQELPTVAIKVSTFLCTKMQ